MPALPVPVQLATGVNATWFAPIDARLNFAARTTEARAGIWLDEAAHAAGRQPLEVATLSFDSEAMDAAPGASLDLSTPLLALVSTRAPFAPSAQVKSESA